MIGDSLPFSCRNAVSGRTGDPLTGATAAWQLLEAETLEVKASGSMSSFDDSAEHGAGAVSFEAVVPASETAQFDAEDEPDGLVPAREYLLKATLTHSGNTTSKAVRLVAALYPPST